MTVILGDTGKVAYGSLKTFNFSLATPRETLQGTPTALPSSAPGSPQVTMTIATGDLPTVSPDPLSTKYCAILYIGGKNTDASSQSVSYQVYKNGSAVSGATGSHSVPAGQFWTESHMRFYDVIVGDVLGVAVWCASANVNYDYYTMQVYPTRVNVGRSYLNIDVTYSGISSPPNLVSGTPSTVITQNPIMSPTTGSTPTVSIASALKFGALNWNSSMFSFQEFYSDNNLSSSGDPHATFRPYYRCNSFPTSISFREILR